MQDNPQHHSITYTNQPNATPASRLPSKSVCSCGEEFEDRKGEPYRYRRLCVGCRDVHINRRDRLVRAATGLIEIGWTMGEIQSALVGLTARPSPPVKHCTECGEFLKSKSKRCLKCSGLAPITYEPGYKFPGTAWEFVEYIYTNLSHSGQNLSWCKGGHKRPEKNAKLLCNDCGDIFTVRLQSVRDGSSKRCVSCARKARQLSRCAGRGTAHMDNTSTLAMCSPGPGAHIGNELALATSSAGPAERIDNEVTQ